MQPITFEERKSSRRSQKRLKAFLVAFCITLAVTAVALFIWDDVPQTTNKLSWEEVPVVRIWTFFLIILGTPALTAIVYTVMPLPKGRSLTIDDNGVSGSFRSGTIRRTWREIAGLGLYPHPDGKSFVEVTAHAQAAHQRGWLDLLIFDRRILAARVSGMRIRDIYQTPLPEVLDALRTFHRKIAGAAGAASAASADSLTRKVFEGDLQKQAYRPYSAFFIVLIVAFMALRGVFEMPGWLVWLVLGMALPFFIYQISGASRLRSDKLQLVLDEDEFSVVVGAQKQSWSWSDIADIRVHGRTGFWATPRHIVIGVPAGKTPRLLRSLWGRIFGHSKLVIPDAFLASLDEIANRLGVLRDRNRQAGA